MMKWTDGKDWSESSGAFNGTFEWSIAPTLAVPMRGEARETGYHDHAIEGLGL